MFIGLSAQLLSFKSFQRSIYPQNLQNQNQFFWNDVFACSQIQHSSSYCRMLASGSGARLRAALIKASECGVNNYPQPHNHLAFHRAAWPVTVFECAVCEKCATSTDSCFQKARPLGEWTTISQVADLIWYGQHLLIFWPMDLVILKLFWIKIVQRRYASMLK